MGRRYLGDIEGKFWVGVQDSDDASFFGGCENEPSYLEYYFTTDDLPDIKKGIEECRQRLGANRKKLSTFFKEHNSYTDKQLADYLGIAVSKEEADRASIPALQEILKWYARLELGEKIEKCVKKTGECCFEAEL